MTSITASLPPHGRLSAPSSFPARFDDLAIGNAELSSARSQIKSQLRIALECPTSPPPVGVVVVAAKIGLEAIVDVIGELRFVLIAEHFLAETLAVGVGSPI